MSNNLFFLGYGYVAQYFALQYGNKYKLSSSINKSKENYFESNSNIKKTNFSKITDHELDQYSNFLISIPPDYQQKTDPVIEDYYQYFLNRKTKYKLIYLSATSVYGDHKGKKVTEQSSLLATSKNGLARITTEAKYQQLSKNNNANIIILRLSAIYGPLRNNIQRIKDKTSTSNKISNNKISRIHVEDISNIIGLILENDQINNQIFNLADDRPEKTEIVNNFICEKLLKIRNLPLIENNETNQTMSFSLDNKLVDNEKIKKILNYEFKYSNYKAGLKDIFSSM
jgi:NAD dependent epimerase/dehydratase family enzyme